MYTYCKRRIKSLKIQKLQDEKLVLTGVGGGVFRESLIGNLITLHRLAWKTNCESYQSGLVLFDELQNTQTEAAAI